MAANNYYGYGYNSNVNQYSTVTGNSGYATGSHAQHAIHVQSAYPPSQTTVQYGPYGTRNQVTGQGSAYGETASRYYGQQSGTGDSYYQQKNKSYPAASSTYQSHTFKSTYEPSYPAASNAPKVSTSEWQPQNKPAPNYGGNSTSQQTYTSSSTAPKAAVSQSYSAPTSSANAAVETASSYSGLDAAVYSAATDYLLQKQKGGIGSNWYKSFKGGRGPPDPSQWKYCELCKCTCAGLQAYKAHLVGKAHKKKEAMATSGSSLKPASTPKTGSSGSHFYCQLCDVVCSSSDAYSAHMRGSKHQRILKLQLKMGKPIPTQDVPTTTQIPENKTAAPPSAKILKTATSNAQKVYSTPRMAFVGGTQLKTTGVQMEEVAIDSKSETQTGISESSDYSSAGDQDVDDKNAQPVGLEYIEESLNETRTAPNFYCKLCDCSFTDPHAKVMHTKGRRHRLQYKKKVDPSLKVDMKVTPLGSRGELERVKRRIAAGEFWRKKEIQDSYKMEAEDLRYEKELLQWQLEKTTMRFDSSLLTGAPVSAAVTSIDKLPSVELGHKRDADHINSRHAAVYPTEADLEIVQKLVSTYERVLKLVSDHLATNKIERDLKGVMRVGLLAKGLLLHDCLDFELVVLCSCKPTQDLLREITGTFPEQLKTFSEEEFDLTVTPDNIGFTLEQKGEIEHKIKCTISLTSPSVTQESDENTKLDSSLVPLDVKSCLRSLAALRHAKWFQAKVTNLFSCVIVVRIMMDFCRRVPTWSVVSQWSLELLVEKCIGSETSKLGPAIALRRVFEVVASGILLPGGPGIHDPCEKASTDAFDYLTDQDREDLTNSAQHALRLIAFGEIHKVLGMEPLPLPAKVNSNKRKRTSTS